jgi:penicillin-binding protein 1C
MTRRLLRLSALLVLAPVIFVVVLAALTPLPAELLEGATSGSVRVTDAGGRTLREVRATDGALAAWISLGSVGPHVVHAMLAAEDRRFYDHLGVDPVAIVRAVYTDLAQGRFAAGGSTLTMQLARTLRPHPRTLRGKIGEAALAVRIEWSLGKDQILEQYINRAGFGPNLRGLAAASQAYFDKSPGSLSLAEAGLLAGLPRGPSLYDVTKRPELARRRRDRVIDRMASAGWITSARAEEARSEPLLPQAHRPSFGAPHLVAGLVSGAVGALQPGLADALRGPVTRIETTIDADLQRVAEAQIAAAMRELEPKGIGAASAVVVENATGDVLAYVGAPDFFDAPHLGRNDGTRARRQPGSTLKPFLYELAMEKLGFDPSTRLPDVELHVDEEGQDYAPRDYDDHFRGPVRLREALGSSLNVPAVWTALEVGVEPFLARLHELGFDALDKDAGYYGPALALGDGEVTLLELVRAYATLARSGVDRPLRFVTSVERGGDAPVAFDPLPEHRVMPARYADLVTDVLKDHDARRGSFGDRTVLDFPFEAAAKTGTSKGYRDNWAVGFTRTVTVGIWAGNMSGEPMTDVSGITGAGPLLHAILEAAMQGRAPSALPVTREEHRGLARVPVCALSGDAAGPDCPHWVDEWVPDDEPRGPRCTMHERVRIERATGLRAGKACAADQVEERVFERFPPELAAWAETAGRTMAPRAWSPACPAGPGDGTQDEGELRIVYPLAGARFVLDPDRPRETQVLDVRIIAPREAREATLRVDGTEVARVGPPFDARWPLAPGWHDLEAEVAGARSARVRVYVRGDDGTDGVRP